MIRASLLSLALVGVMSSCFFVDDIFDPPEEAQPSLQERSEKAVSEYIRAKSKELYEPYGFGAITIHKPVEIIELEKMQQKAKTAPSAELDSAIFYQKKLIRDYNIERTIDLDHFFTLTDSTGRFSIFETNFTLNDTLGVKDLSAKLMVRMDSKFEDVLDYFFYEYNIFRSPSYYDSKNLSANFYAFFKQELERRTELSEKSDFLRHVLKLTYEVKEEGAFDQQLILEKLVTNHIQEERPDIQQYSNLSFSDLYQTSAEGSDAVSGYYFFHKFMGSYQGQLDTNVVMIEFSPYYELNNIYQMDRPFEQYFKQ